MDTHAQGRWFEPCEGKYVTLPQWTSANTARCPDASEKQSSVSKFHAAMPSMLLKRFGVRRVVSLFDATRTLATTQGTGWRNMTWDGYHWGMAVNLLKAQAWLAELDKFT